MSERREKNRQAAKEKSVFTLSSLSPLSSLSLSLSFYFRPPLPPFALHAPGEGRSRSKSTCIDSDKRSGNHAAASGRPGIAECGILFSGRHRSSLIVDDVPFLCRSPPLRSSDELQRPSRYDLPGFFCRLGDCQEKKQQSLCRGRRRDRCAGSEWRGELELN